MKTKTIALLEIAIVLFSLFLVAIPAIAADQTMQKASASEVTTASEDDYVLGVYGNANEDDTIDMRDLTYVKLIFFGKKPETELADAKYDGKINPLDFIQIKLIIVGKEKEITIVCSPPYGEVTTVKKPVERIVVLSDPQADAIRVLEAENRVVGIGSGIAKEETLLPVMHKMPTVGKFNKPDPEAILALTPDIVIAYGKYSPELEEKIEPYVTVVRLDLKDPEVIVGDIKKLGYILDKKDEAEEFIDFYNGHISTIRERVEGISEEDKPLVYFEYYPSIWEYKTAGKASSDQECKIVGGINIAADLASFVGVDPEWVVDQNPNIIILIEVSTLPCGYGTDDITGMKVTREKVMNRPGFKIITAIKNEDVYVISSDIRCGIQKVIGIAYWAKWFHPELFEDVNPKAIHQVYIDRFQRIDYDLDKHGVFVYPEPS